MSANGDVPIWPAGHRAALCLTFDVDGLFGEANYQPASNTYAISQAEYDQTGTARTLDILADRGVSATYCWVGREAEERPALVERAFDDGHEIALHTWEHQYYNAMTKEQQRADMLRTSAALQAITGAAPTGHKTGGWRYNTETFELAQELGLNWVMDVPNGDTPTFLQPDPERPPLVNLPPSAQWDDYNFFVDRMVTPMQAYEFWREDLDVLRDDGGILSLTLHPFVSCRPGTSRAWLRLLDYAIDLGDIWIARADHIARWWIERAKG